MGQSNEGLCQGVAISFPLSIHCLQSLCTADQNILDPFFIATNKFSCLFIVQFAIFARLFSTLCRAHIFLHNLSLFFPYLLPVLTKLLFHHLHVAIFRCCSA